MPNPLSPWWNREEGEKLCIALCYVRLRFQASGGTTKPLQLQAARAPTCRQQVGLRSQLQQLFLYFLYCMQQTSQLLFLHIGRKTASSIDYLNHFIAIKPLWFQSASVSSSPFCMGGGKNAKVASAVLHECLLCHAPPVLELCGTGCKSAKFPLNEFGHSATTDLRLKWIFNVY